MDRRRDAGRGIWRRSQEKNGGGRGLSNAFTSDAREERLNDDALSSSIMLNFVGTSEGEIGTRK